ncbi:MAG: glycoside hydrolase [Candidatus Brocadia sp. WS118]|nr:MAG: glycoside hydrolase [Candidatus Brocadia sp. WS118]
MDRYICIHGHFYQPPRENPWLEAIELQDSAVPYHDWNERITAECYSRNTASRILDGEGRIREIVSNYARISFNFGPTLLSWMEKYAPAIYRAILDADRKSMEWRSGHGNAIAQVYNHVIMPLANTRDKRTQILWGIRDFEHRFQRFPEGMWLSETAADIESLDILAEHGIKFTILAPHQASRVRKVGTEKWKDVSGGQIDPTRAYVCKLPSGKTLNIFFYDGPISRAVAFEKLLTRGEDFASRLLSGFSDKRKWPQLLHIATDGESYGHHHRFGDMSLAFALNDIESRGLARLTNYGEYLEKHPPTHEVVLFPNSSWSCMHGIERWKSNCGCNSGGHPEWNQEWRAPLRDAFDWLRDQLIIKYEQKAKKYLKDPWQARDEYITLFLNRSGEHVNKFFERHVAKTLSAEEIIFILELLEIQRNTLLMYTSCGWFFDELSGIETIQIMQYAGRAIQLSEKVFGYSIENVFLDKLVQAKSNITEQKDGAHIYEKFIKPAMIDAKKVGVHYAVSSIFEDYPENTGIYCYTVTREDYHREEAGKIKIAVGRASIRSEIIRETERLCFCVLYLGNHDFNGGVHTFLRDDTYKLMKDEIMTLFEKGAFLAMVRLMDKHFGMHNYSLKHLFKDEQRKIVNQVISSTVEEFEETYRHMYENNRILMGFLQETGMPIPRVFHTAAEFTLNQDLKKACEEEKDSSRIQSILLDIKKWNIPVDASDHEFAIRHRIETLMDELRKNPAGLSLLQRIERKLQLFSALPFEINLWHVQNVYYDMAKTTYKEFLIKAKAGDTDAAHWIETFRQIGHRLSFNIAAALPDA